MKKETSQLFVYPKTWVKKETEDIAKSIRQWANKEIVSRRLEYLDNYAALFPEGRKKLAFDIGCQGLVMPSQNKGSGMNSPGDAGVYIAVLKEIGRADASIGFIHACEYAVTALFAMETRLNKALCEQMAPVFCAEALNSVSLILPGSGRADVAYPLFEGRPVTVALTAGENGHALSGVALRPLGLGADAAFYAVVAADNNGKTGIALVSSTAAGVKRHAPFKKTGLDGCGNCDVDFSNVMIPETHWIAGERSVHELYGWLNLLLGAVSVGAAMGCLEVAGEWADERVIKAGGLIKNNPLCASVLAEAYEEIALSWMMAHHLAYAMAHPGEWGENGSPMMFAFAQMTGRRIQEGALKAVNKMMELMASEGYAREGRVEQAWRDIKTIQAGICGAGGEAPARLDLARYVFDSQAM